MAKAEQLPEDRCPRLTASTAAADPVSQERRPAQRSRTSAPRAATSQRPPTGSIPAATCHLILDSRLDTSALQPPARWPETRPYHSALLGVSREVERPPALTDPTSLFNSPRELPSIIVAVLVGGSRARLAVLAAVAVLVGISAVSAVRAQDPAAAWSSVLMGLVGVAVAVAPPLGGKSRLSQHELEAQVRGAAISVYNSEANQLDPEADRATVGVSEVLRVSTRTGRQSDTKRLAELVQEAGNRVALLGPAGSGKTTAAIDLLGAWFDKPPSGHGTSLVPFYVRLSSWTDEKDFETWLANRVAELSDLRVPQARLAIPRLALILDGLDEVSEAWRRDLADALRDFLERYKSAFLVLTSRPREFALLADRLTSLRTFRLATLDPDAISALLVADDPQHWAPVVKEVQRPNSPLAGALQTPLMAHLALESWANGSVSALIATSSRAGATEEDVKRALWDRRVAAAEEYTSPGTIGLAVALARSAKEAETDEIRLEDLGTRRTRTAWWLIWGIVVAALGYATSSVGFSTLATIGPLGVALGFASLRYLPERYLPSWAVWILLGIGAFLLGWVGYAFGGVKSHWLAAAVGVVGGVVPAAADLEPAASPWTLRLSHVVAVRAALTISLSALICVATTAAVAAYDTGLVPLALGAGFSAAYILDFEFGMHHLLVRVYWRLRNQRRALGPQLAALVRAGVLRRAGTNYRFYHLELRDHLAAQLSDGNPYRLENAGLGRIFEQALQASPPDAKLKLWDRYLARDPLNEPAVYNRALALERQGRSSEARAGFEAARRLRPRDALNVSACTRMALAAGDLHAALDLASRLVSISPSDPLAYAYLGAALWEAGNADDALAALDTALTRAPDEPAVLTTRAQILEDLGRSQTAQRDRDRACELDPHPISIVEGLRR